MSRLDMDFTVIDATSHKGVRNVISNRRVITGRVSILGVGAIPFEGSLERDFLEVQDFNRNLSYAGAQPLKILFKEDGRSRKYTPDFLTKFQPLPDGRTPSPILREIKPLGELREKWLELLPGFRRAARLCQERDWRFRISTERTIRGPQFPQIKFLRGYLDYPDRNCIGQILYEQMKTLKVSTPAALLAACFENRERRLEAVGILWKLVADGRIRIDFTKPLNMETRIWSMWHDPR